MSLRTFQIRLSSAHTPNAKRPAEDDFWWEKQGVGGLHHLGMQYPIFGLDRLSPEEPC